MQIGVVCVACAPIGGDPYLARRVDEQDMQLRQMQPQQADTLNEVRALREEIDQLKGQLAQLRQQNTDQTPLNPQPPASPGGINQQAIASDAQMQNEPHGITLPPGNAPDSSAYGLSAPSTGTTLATALPAAQSGQTGEYGLPVEQAPVAAVAPSGATWGMADPTPEAAAPEPEPKKDLAQALFEAGVNDYNARKYKAAERSFNDFIKNYSKHAKVSDAQYYLAECYFASNNFTQAALAFDDIITKYPKSSRASVAYLKEGIAFSKMGKPEAARMRLNELIKKFPNSAEAKRAQAFLKTNK